MIKTVIFDLDGLLADTEQAYLDSYIALFARYGIPFTKEIYVRDHLGATAIANAEKVAELYDIPMSAEEIFDYLVATDQKCVDQGVPLKKGARELLDYLKDHGYQIVIASSSLPKRAAQILRYNEADAYFTVSVYGPDVERSKPAPDIFLTACEKAGTVPEECLVLEDSMQGIEAAYAAHTKVICVPDLREPDERHREMCDRICASLLDVIDYLEEEKTSS